MICPRSHSRGMADHPTNPSPLPCATALGCPSESPRDCFESDDSLVSLRITESSQRAEDFAESEHSSGDSEAVLRREGLQTPAPYPIGWRELPEGRHQGLPLSPLGSGSSLLAVQRGVHPEPLPLGTRSLGGQPSLPVWVLRAQVPGRRGQLMPRPSLCPSSLLPALSCPLL